MPNKKSSRTTDKNLRKHKKNILNTKEKNQAKKKKIRT